MLTRNHRATLTRVQGAQAASLHPLAACRRIFISATLRPSPLIKTGLAGWSGFPAAMDPDPLPGICADEFFDLGRVERGGIDDVFLGVAGSSDGFDEFTNQNAIAVCIPHAARRNDERVGAQGQHGDGAGSTGKMTKEGDKDAVAAQCIYVGEKGEVTASVKDGETLQNRIAFVNGTVAEPAAHARGVAIEQTIVERASKVGDRLERGGSSKGEYLPVAKVWRNEDDAASSSLGGAVAVLECLRERGFNASGQIGRGCARKMREVGNNTTKVFEGLFEQSASLGQGQIGESEFEVPQADTTQTRQRRKKGAAHEHGNSRGERKRQQRE